MNTTTKTAETEIEVTGTYIPYRPATYEQPEEGGYWEDVKYRMSGNHKWIECEQRGDMYQFCVGILEGE